MHDRDVGNKWVLVECYRSLHVPRSRAARMPHSSHQRLAAQPQDHPAVFGFCVRRRTAAGRLWLGAKRREKGVTQTSDGGLSKPLSELNQRFGHVITISLGTQDYREIALGSSLFLIWGLHAIASRPGPWLPGRAGPAEFWMMRNL